MRKDQFHFKYGIDVDYVRQGYIYFTSRRFGRMDRIRQDRIRELCRRAGGDYQRALLEFVTKDVSATAVCHKHHVSESTLYRIVKLYYENFPDWI